MGSRRGGARRRRNSRAPYAPGGTDGQPLGRPITGPVIRPAATAKGGAKNLLRSNYGDAICGLKKCYQKGIGNTDSGRGPRAMGTARSSRRRWRGSALALIVELLSGLSAIGFILSCAISYVAFGVFGFNYFELATPSDVAMNGLNYLLILIGALSFWVVFALLFRQMVELSPLMRKGPLHRAKTGRRKGFINFVLFFMLILPGSFGFYDLSALLCACFCIIVGGRLYFRYPRTWDDRVRCSLWPRRGHKALLVAKLMSLIYFIIIVSATLVATVARFWTPVEPQLAPVFDRNNSPAALVAVERVLTYQTKLLHENQMRMLSKPAIEGKCGDNIMGRVAWSGSNNLIILCPNQSFKIIYGYENVSAVVRSTRAEPTDSAKN